MSRVKSRFFCALAVLLTALTAQAQQWTVFQLPTTMAEVPAKIEQQFGCTWQELAEKQNITHLKITGMDFSLNIGGSSYEGGKALRQLVVKARELDFSEVTANPDWGIYSKYYHGPDAFVFMDEMGLNDLDSLRRIVFPKVSRTLYGGSLLNCEKLEEVVWPDAPLELDYYMFDGCKSLKHIDIPGTIAELPSHCFEGCSGLQTVTMHEGLKIIGDQAFQSCNALETVTLPDGVETLNDACFRYCEGLKTISLSQSVTSIGSSAFYGCAQLENCTLSNRVKILSSGMFYGCKALASITLPDSTETIENDVFSQCPALRSVDMPAGLTAIGNSAFRNSAIEEFNMPDAVTTLGDYVFDSCKQLRKVHLSRALSAIPMQCFYGCEVLEEVNIPQRVTQIGNDAFRDCVALPSPMLPEGLTLIGDAAFMGCRFENITLPQSLEVIGAECFRYSSLQSIDVPASVVQIGNSAFANCASLRRATLHEGLLYLQDHAFMDCELLEDVPLPNSLRVLGEWAFHNNKSKKSFVLPPLVKVVPDHVCCQCEQLTSVTLHDRVTAIDGNAFDGCIQLEHIDLPEGLADINNYAFAGCPLQEVGIPSTVRTISDAAFNGGKYRRVALPEGVRTVGASAFRSDNLRYVDFPSSIETLGSFAFHGNGPACDSIVLRAPLPPNVGGQLYGMEQTGALYVPASSVEAYRNNDTFAKYSFSNILPLPGYTPENVVVAQTLSTDSAWMPVPPNANLIIAHGAIDSWGGLISGHLHVGSNISWPVNNLRYDYSYSWPDYDWELSQPIATLVNEGTMTAKSMEMNMEFFVNRWLFFTPPFDMKASDIACSDSRTPYVLRTFEGAQRAAGNHDRVWADVPANATLQAGHGYILQHGEYLLQHGINEWVNQSSGVVFNLKNSSPLRAPSLSSEAVTIPLVDYEGEFEHNEGWNFVGNPFMAYYDIQGLESDAPILVAQRPWFASFRAYSPLDDDLVLRPLEAFLVQRSPNQSGMTFDPAGRQPQLESQREAVNSARSLRRAKLRQQRVVYDATLLRQTEQGDSLMASTRFVLTPRATEGYDRGCDAPFITLDEQLTALYTRSGGLRYSLNELPPTTQSVQIGLVIAEPGTYTISLNCKSASGQSITLLDKETGARTDIADDSYTFTVDAPATLNNRFVLQLGNGITAVPSVAMPSQQTEPTYDLQGRRVTTPARGLYIRNGKKIIR